MIEPSSRVDKALGINLKKVYNTISSAAVRRTDRKDTVMISQFSSLVEQARRKVLELPDVRTDRVREARAALANGTAPKALDIASAIMDHASNGEVG